MKTVYLSESHENVIRKSVINEDGWVRLLTEENSGIKKKVKKIIAQYCSPYVSDYLETPLAELPYWLSSQLNPGGHETAMYSAVKNNPNENRFIDFLKVNLYDQLGCKYDKGPWEYVVGAARILCSELGFYSFSPNEMRGGDIIKFAKMLRLIHHNKDFFIGGEQDMDRDLNGMTYDQFMGKFLEKYNALKENMFDRLGSEKANGGHYKVVRIEDTVTYQGVVPTGQGRQLLNQLDNYTDWCICGSLQDFEYPQYTAGGGAVYVMLRDGFEHEPKEVGENCPLDNYGLSLICVIVGPDGIPDNITTRWNHENGGENPEGMHTALQLQQITGVKYKEAFKPRNEAELRSMHINEDADKPSAMDQVHNKVNAGIMDAVTGGGMMEEEVIDENSNDRKVNKYIKEKFGLTDFQDIRNKVMEIYEKIPYARINGGQYMLGVLRLLFEENLPREDYGILNKILYKIGNSYGPEKQSINDGNLGGWSFEQLKEKFFVPDFEGDKFSTAEKIVKLPNGYTVTRIDSYDEMNAMCDGEWCISYDESMWLELTSDATVYLVENEKLIDKHDEAMEDREYADNFSELAYAAGEEDDMMEMGFLNSDLAWTNKPGSWKFPYDYYGLSRFVVLVGKEWMAVYSRYNMPNEFDGDYLTKGQLEKLLGVNFNEVFKYIPRDYTEGHYDNYGRWRVDSAPSVSEGAEPEADEYRIGGEGGNNEYFHAINESHIRKMVESVIKNLLSI